MEFRQQPYLDGWGSVAVFLGGLEVGTVIGRLIDDQAGCARDFNAQISTLRASGETSSNASPPELVMLSVVMVNPLSR